MIAAVMGQQMQCIGCLFQQVMARWRQRVDSLNFFYCRHAKHAQAALMFIPLKADGMGMIMIYTLGEIT